MTAPLTVSAARSVTAGDEVTGPVLLLTPSRGLGGGIERYVQTVEWAFAKRGVTHSRLDLERPGPPGHWRLLAAATAQLGGQAPARLIVAHPALVPVAALLARRRPVAGISVICHGSDVWGARARPRWQLESRLMRRPGMRVVTVSSFTAGALFPGCPAVILPPGLDAPWFDELVRAADTRNVPVQGGTPAPVRLMTAFRLGDWRDKGLADLTAAVAALGRPEVTLTICGSGRPPADLLGHVAAFPWCTVRAGLADRELADELAAADLFVLATRTRSGPHPCGEGFGLVLLEAQIAGTAVVAPAHGGSADAYVEGVTGVAPPDESAEALASTLVGLLGQPARLTWMGERAATWARECFDPGRYAELAVRRLL